MCLLQTLRFLVWQLCALSYLNYDPSPKQGYNVVNVINKPIRLQVWYVITLIIQLVGFTKLVEMLFE